jgi:hypothetical protein
MKYPRIIHNPSSLKVLIGKHVLAKHVEENKLSFLDQSSVGISSVGVANRIWKYFTTTWNGKKEPLRLFASYDAVKMDKNYPLLKKFIGALNFFISFDWDFENWNFDQEMLLLQVSEVMSEIIHPVVCVESWYSTAYVLLNTLSSGHVATTWMGNFYSRSNIKTIEIAMIRKDLEKIREDLGEACNILDVDYGYLKMLCHGDDLLLSIWKSLADKEKYKSENLFQVLKENVGIEYLGSDAHKDKSWLDFFSKVDHTTGKILHLGVDYLKKVFIQENGRMYYMMRTEDALPKLFKSPLGICGIENYCSRLVGVASSVGANDYILNLVRFMFYQLTDGDSISMRVSDIGARKNKIRGVMGPVIFSNAFYREKQIPAIKDWVTWARNDKAFLNLYPYYEQLVN